MNSKHTHLLRTHHGSHKTLWFGLLGAIVVIVGSIFLAYAQTQKKEAEKMNPTKPMPAEAELRRQLSKDQYRVTRECGTETPFQNAYWDNHRAGIYVDIITGEPLFSSLDKFDSGTRWPSFTKPISNDNVVEERRGCAQPHIRNIRVICGPRLNASTVHPFNGFQIFRVTSRRISRSTSVNGQK